MMSNTIIQFTNIYATSLEDALRWKRWGPTCGLLGQSLHATSWFVQEYARVMEENVLYENFVVYTGQHDNWCYQNYFNFDMVQS
jgi:hypothetical protein